MTIDELKEDALKALYLNADADFFDFDQWATEWLAYDNGEEIDFEDLKEAWNSACDESGRYDFLKVEGDEYDYLEGIRECNEMKSIGPRITITESDINHMVCQALNELVNLWK